MYANLPRRQQFFSKKRWGSGFCRLSCRQAVAYNTKDSWGSV